jgi:Cys-tRNA(Pro)/Cys-tRNA(Cys) deacylase
MAPKLNSMRLLERHDIPYEVIEYPDTIKDAEAVAEAIGAPPHMVYKTLVVERAGEKKLILVMLACDRRLDLKRMATAAGVKKCSMAAHKDAERLTGLKVGGISALALTHKTWDVYLDQPATELEHLIISAGQRGMQIRLSTSGLMQVVGAKIVEVSAE